MARKKLVGNFLGNLQSQFAGLCIKGAGQAGYNPYKYDCESFARRTFTTPKIRTFTTPQKKLLPGGQLPPPIFLFFFFSFLAHFFGFFDLQLMEDIKDGKEEVLDEVVMEHIK